MNELSDKQKDIKEQTKEFSEELKKLIDEINKMKEQMSAKDLGNLQKKMQQKNPKARCRNQVKNFRKVKRAIQRRHRKK